MSFWKTLEYPVFVLAPMADVTDAAFRRMFAKYGVPDVTWTEFVSADGLFLRPIEPGVGDDPTNNLEEVALKHGVGTDNPLLKDLMYTEDERPIVAQFFSTHPDLMKRAAALARDLGFDGIDLNMGCPAQVICRQGSGAAMIKTPQKAREIIRATKEGAGELPVTVKTRIGYNKIELETWLPELLAENPEVVTLHARTRKEMSKVPAHWEEIRRAVEIRDGFGSTAKIFGNGDVFSLDSARERIEETGCDGVMIGRGIFGNPWFFRYADVMREDMKRGVTRPEGYRYEPTLEEKLNVLIEHTYLFEELLGDTKNFALMKKHYKAYVTGFDGAKELRMKLMECENPEEIEAVVRTFLTLSSY